MSLFFADLLEARAFAVNVFRTRFRTDYFFNYAL